MEQPTTAAGRKRKNRFGEMQLDSSSVQLKARRVDVVAPETSVSPANSENSSCESAASCCSSNGPSDDLAKWTSKFVDLEDGEVTPELFATSVGESFSCRERGEMPPPSGEVEAEPGELESTARLQQSNNCHQLHAPEAELEDFFSSAEQNLQKQFMDKYNFDIVKDEPLEGRYEWVKIKVKP